VGGESPFLSFGGEGPPTSEAEEREFLGRVDTLDNALAIIAEWRTEIVGYLVFTGGNRSRMRHAGEFGISVARACQGIGLGRRMLEMLIDWARRGAIVRKINLVVRPDNRPAIALYESLGFAVEGRKRRGMLVEGEFTDALLMGLLVDPGDATH